MIETIILCLINLVSFVVGAKIGMDISNKKEITLNPIKAIHDYKKEKQSQKEESLREKQYKTILNNIDSYDGTSTGQVKIPKK